VTHQDLRRRALAALADHDAERRDWFHIGPVLAEVVGEQTDGDGGSSKKSADVYIFDRIGGWSGTTASSFVRDVAALDVDQLNVHLNSPGGDSADGVAIANVLRQHKADVTVWVDGLAASAASVVAMAGDEVVMGVGAQLMIHDAWALCVGDAAEMRKAAEMLDSTSNAIAATYAAKAGGTAAEWREVMAAESWYTGEEAVAAKLADRVATDEDKGTASGEQVVPGKAQPSFWDMWDSLSDADRHRDVVAALYAHAGRGDAPPPRMPRRPATKTPAATASGSSHKEGSAPVPFTDEHLATLRTKLGLAADADEDKIVDTVIEVMDEFVKTDPPSPLPEGAVAIDGGVLEQLRTDAAAGRAAREQQQTEHRAALVQAAIADGRITPRNRDRWLEKLEVEGEGAEADLASLAKGLVPVAELGHDTMPAAQEDLSWFDTAPTAPTSQEG
jgi:ATP-dependent protease ClpP protease subunit